ncbi:Sensory transduction protein regX3 [Austwickia sp. TVS 96-490-7B]|nr:Sensory transduction protein regX3 [Austwickia sp. TVS 96-490-7B]
MHTDVLMIDDDTDLADSTLEYLGAFGVSTHHVRSGEEALTWLEKHSASTLLLDVNLPGMSGYATCREIRHRQVIPTLFLSGRTSEDDQVLALSVGGDDFLCKPYPMSVLLAKVQRALARARTSASASTARPIVIDDGWLQFDSTTGRVHVDGHEVHLTSLEYRLLRHLASRHGQVVTKEDLFTHVWAEPLTSDSTLSVHIRRLRRRIERDPDHPAYLRTVWGRGYLFEAGGQVTR